MGSSSSKRNKQGRDYEIQYIDFLKRKQRGFMKRETEKINTDEKQLQFSFISDVDDREVDWKVFYEDFLQEHMDTCFWASPLLE